MPYNQVSVCTTRPRSWDSDDSSACLPLCLIPPSCCFPEALGLQGGAGEPKLASPNVPPPHPGRVSSQVATSQVQVAHGHLALGSL